MAKYLVGLLAIIILISCKKKGEAETNLIAGKIARNTCIDPLVQILDEDHYSLGEQWSSDAEFGIGRYLFSVHNITDYTLHDLELGDTIYFKVIPAPIVPNMIECDMSIPSPEKRHNIYIQKK